MATRVVPKSLATYCSAIVVVGGVAAVVEDGNLWQRALSRRA